MAAVITAYGRWNGETPGIRRRGRARRGGGVLLGARLRGDFGPGPDREDRTHRRQPLQRLRRQALALSEGTRPLCRPKRRGPQPALRRTTAAPTDPTILHSNHP